MSQSLIYLLVAGILWVATGCTKENTDISYLEPVAIIAPTTNPANAAVTQPVVYKIKLTNDDHIDSSYMFIQLDSLGSYFEERDTVFKKVVYPPVPKTNERVIEGIQPLPFNVTVGRKVYMTFRMYSKSKIVNKRLTLTVI